MLSGGAGGVKAAVLLVLLAACFSRHFEGRAATHADVLAAIARKGVDLVASGRFTAESLPELTYPLERAQAFVEEARARGTGSLRTVAALEHLCDRYRAFLTELERVRREPGGSARAALTEPLAAVVAARAAVRETLGLGAAALPRPSGDRVRLIGVDAATWDVMRPLMEAGELPTFARLVDEGWSGTLMSMEPTVSPALWTTMATGKHPEQHGITGFLAPAEDGTQVPVTTNLRRTEALWNMVGRGGRRVNVIGWYVTWPVEQVRGVMVADRFSPRERGRLVGGLDSLGGEHRGVHPSELTPELEALMVRPEDFLGPTERRFHERFTIYPVDATRVAIAEHVMATHPADLDMVYLWGIDPTQHYFWQYYQPESWPGPKAPETRIARNRHRIPAYYRDTDAFVARLVADMGPRDTVLIVSDHGAGPVTAYDPEKPVSGDHRLEGIIIAAGNHVQPGRAFEPPSVADVTPTVLHLLGLPVGRDMRGRVITEMMPAAFLAEHPVETIATWETGARGAEEHAVRSTVDDTIKEKLRGLGYIE